MSFFVCQITKSGEKRSVNMRWHELLAGQAGSDNGNSFAEQGT